MEDERGKNYIPEIIKDRKNGVSYMKGRFYGKGSFAECYEIIDIRTKNIFAAKIISKKFSSKSRFLRRVCMKEIKLHRSLDYKHIVRYYGSFEDHYNIYIVLELCRNRTMLELLMRRKVLTEPEVRYFMQQIVLGLHYLHQHRIIHRDLKLANLFLDDNLNVKIADFGLAVEIEYDGEMQKTVCGTRQYFSPEMIARKSYSYEVDVWLLGCIMHQLLIGEPVWTDTRGRQLDYNQLAHSNISKPAISLITHMLQRNPQCRPKVAELLKFEFFTDGFIPKQLPATCLITAPKFDGNLRSKSLLRVNAACKTSISLELIVIDYKICLKELVKRLDTVLKTFSGSKFESRPNVELTDPASRPAVWVTKWVDGSPEHGFSCQLSDGSVWVMFNDCSRLGVHANKKNLYYILENETQFYYTMSHYPQNLSKKVKILCNFEQYLKNVKKMGAKVPVRESDVMSRSPYLCHWLQSYQVVGVILSNATVQLQLLDRTIIILCPLMDTVTYIDKSENFLTLKLSSIAENGCCNDLAIRLKFAYSLLNHIFGVDNNVKPVIDCKKTLFVSNKKIQ